MAAEPLWWRRVRHQLAWIIPTHQLRLSQAFSNPPPPRLRRLPEGPLPPHELPELLRYFGMLGEGADDPSGQALLLASHGKCDGVHGIVWRAAGPVLSEATDEQMLDAGSAQSHPVLLEADWATCVRSSPNAEQELLDGKLSALDAAGAVNASLMRKAAMTVRTPLDLLLQEAGEAGREVHAADARQPALLAAHYALEAARSRHLQLQLLYCFNFGRSLQREALPSAQLPAIGRAAAPRHCAHGASSEVLGTAAGMLTVIDADGRPMLYKPAVEDLTQTQAWAVRIATHFEMPTHVSGPRSVHTAASVAQAVAAVSRVLQVELRFQLAKQPLLHTISRLRRAARHPEDASALAQLLANLIAQRVRLDLDAPDFREAYAAELALLRLRTAICERVLGVHVQERCRAVRLRAGLRADAAKARPPAGSSLPSGVFRAVGEREEEECVDESSVTLFRELDALLTHLLAQAAAAVPKLSTVAGCKLEAVVLSQVLAVCDRSCLPPPQLPPAWASFAAHAAVAPIVVSGRDEQPTAAAVEAAFAAARAAAQAGAGDAGKGAESSIKPGCNDVPALGGCEGLPVNPTCVRLAAAERRLPPEAGERAAASAALQLWPAITSAWHECEYLRGVLHAQTRQIGWRSWLELSSLIGDSGLPADAAEGARRADPKAILSDGIEFASAVRRGGAGAMLERGAVEGARALLHTLLAERRVLLVLIEQISSVRKERAAGGVPGERRPRKAAARTAAVAAAAATAMPVAVYWRLPESPLDGSTSAQEAPLANRTKLALHGLVSGLRERDERRRAEAEATERTGATLLLVEMQALQVQLRQRAQKLAELRCTASADAMAAESPQLVRIEGLRAALWIAQHELHACEAERAREQCGEYDSLLRELSEETDRMGDTMARNQELHMPEPRGLNASHLARAITGDKAKDPVEAIAQERAAAEAEHARLLEQISELLHFSEVQKPGFTTGPRDGARFAGGGGARAAEMSGHGARGAAGAAAGDVADMLDAEMRLKVRLRQAQAEHALIASRVEALHTAVSEKDEAHATLMRWKVQHVLGDGLASAGGKVAAGRL
jgi:hypothetical protein